MSRVLSNIRPIAAKVRAFLDREASGPVTFVIAAFTAGTILFLCKLAVSS